MCVLKQSTIFCYFYKLKLKIYENNLSGYIFQTQKTSYKNAPSRFKINLLFFCREDLLLCIYNVLNIFIHTYEN